MNLYNEKLLTKYSESLTDISDLTAGENPGIMFYILTTCFGYLLENDPDKVVSRKGVENRRKVNFLIKKLGPLFLTNPQIIENRNTLLDLENAEKDKGIILPDKPVIWTSNHAFKDDILASILTINRHVYLLLGSVPQFYNTFDGVTAWLNGVVLVNRKSKNSKHASMSKAIKIMEEGSDLLMFPEGVWNKTPNQLMLDLWPGIWRIAKETGAPIVPVVHYIRDCANLTDNNPIHTVVDDPIRIDDLSEKAGLEYLREVLAYWYYLMMERYGTSTREEELKGYASAADAWAKQLEARSKTAARYDTAIEFTADYRPKEKGHVIEVWKCIADIQEMTVNNAEFVMHARRLLEEEVLNDFQHRF